VAANGVILLSIGVAMADSVQSVHLGCGGLLVALLQRRRHARLDAQPVAVSRRGVISTESLAVLSHAVPSWTVT